MNRRDDTTEYKLHQEVPAPVEVGLEEAADNGADDETIDKGETQDEDDSVFSLIGIPQVSDWMYGPRAAEDVGGVVLGELKLTLWTEVAMGVWDSVDEGLRLFDGDSSLDIISNMARTIVWRRQSTR